MPKLIGTLILEKKNRDMSINNPFDKCDQSYSKF